MGKLVLARVLAVFTCKVIDVKISQTNQTQEEKMLTNLKGIGIIGQYRSGKNAASSSIARYIAAQEKGSAYRSRTFSTEEKYDVLSKEIYHRKSDPTIRRDLRQALETISPNTFVGSLFYGTVLFANSDPKREPVAVINSIETRSQAELWQSLIPDFHFIYVESDPETRLHNHNIGRAEADSMEQFLTVCEIYGDNRIGLMKTLAMPLNIVSNTGVGTGLKKLQEDVYGILDHIL